MTSTAEYRYIGPAELARSVEEKSPRARLENGTSVIEWIRRERPTLERDGALIATYVVMHDGLWIADRRSEHVACARGGAVYSAGEVRFEFANGRDVAVVEISNQSTGYCPAASSWPAVADALDRAGLSHPGQFTLAVEFRRCSACDSINIVKDAWYVCAVCGASLSGNEADYQLDD